MKFKVQYVEELVHNVWVEAENMDAAIERAEALYCGDEEPVNDECVDFSGDSVNSHAFLAINLESNEERHLA
jgi:hypothetical protein